MQENSSPFLVIPDLIRNPWILNQVQDDKKFTSLSYPMYIIVSTTIDTKEWAYQIANMLVDKKLAACVQIDEVNSVYSWKGKTLDTQEYRLQIKTRENLYDDVAVQIRMMHSYETPEILATPMSHISEAYGTWMESVLRE